MEKYAYSKISGSSSLNENQTVNKMGLQYSLRLVSCSCNHGMYRIRQKWEHFHITTLSEILEVHPCSNKSYIHYFTCKYKANYIYIYYMYFRVNRCVTGRSSLVALWVFLKNT
jgi:hypothetical protein